MLDYPLVQQIGDIMLKEEDKIIVQKVIEILEKIEFPEKLHEHPKYKNVKHSIEHLKFSLE